MFLAIFTFIFVKDYSAMNVLVVAAHDKTISGVWPGVFCNIGPYYLTGLLYYRL